MKLNSLLSENSSSLRKNLQFPQLFEIPSPGFPSVSSLRSIEGKSVSTARSLNNTSLLLRPCGSDNIKGEKLPEDNSLGSKSKWQAWAVSINGYAEEGRKSLEVKLQGEQRVNKRLSGFKNKITRRTSSGFRNSPNIEKTDNINEVIFQNQDDIIQNKGDIQKSKIFRDNNNNQKGKYLILSPRVGEPKTLLASLPQRDYILPKRKSKSTPNILDNYLGMNNSSTNLIFESNLRKVSEYESRQLGLSDDLMKPNRFVRDGNKKQTSLCVDSDEKKKHGSSHLLEAGIWNTFEVRTFHFLYFHIKVKGKICPIKINIRTSESEKLKIFSSSTNPFPSKFSCDRSFEATKIKFGEGSLKKFSLNCIYFCLLSDSTQSLDIKYEFGDLNVSGSAANISPKKTNEEKRRLSIESMSNADLFKAIRLIKEKRKEEALKNSARRSQSPPNEFPDASNGQGQDLREKVNFEERYTQIVEKKKTLEEEQRKKKNYLYYKHEINKILTGINVNQRLLVMQKNYTIYKWFVILHAAALVSEIYQKLKHRIAVLKEIRMIGFKLTRTFWRYKVLARKRGPNTRLRAIVDCRSLTQSYTKLLKEKIRKNLFDILVYVLKANAEPDRLMKCFTAFDKYVYLIQKTWRCFRLKRKNYRILIERLWEKYFSHIYLLITDNFSNNFSSLKNSRKSVLSEKENFSLLKNKYIDHYMEMQMEIYIKSLRNYLKLIREEQIRKKLKYTKLFIEKDEDSPSMRVLMSRSEDVEAFDKIEIKFQSQVVEKVFKKDLLPPRLFVLPTFEKLTEIIKLAIDNKKAREEPTIKFIDKKSNAKRTLFVKK